MHTGNVLMLRVREKQCTGTFPIAVNGAPVMGVAAVLSVGII